MALELWIFETWQLAQPFRSSLTVFHCRTRLSHNSATMHPRKLLMLLVVSATPNSASRLRGAFQQFFPYSRQELQRIMSANCTEEYQAYRNETINLYGTACVKMYSCMMKEVSEYTKANMASSGVLLGLTPWILSTLGSTSAEISLLAVHRPVLAYLLVLGAPAINPSRAKGYQAPLEEHLAYHSAQFLFVVPRRPSLRNIVYVTIELLLATASIINVGLLSRDLALRAIPVMSCDSDMVVGLWVGLVTVSYNLGLATFFSRIQFRHALSGRPGDRWWKRWWATLRYIFRWATFRGILRREFQYGAYQQPLNISWGRENKLFLFFSWITTLFTITHLGYGTLALTSLSFIGKPCRTSSHRGSWLRILVRN